MERGHRLESRILEERIQQAVDDGHRLLEVEAYGQHGIGGRLWRAGNEPVYMKIKGFSGQRIGSMGFPNTFIEVMGPASDDVGWLNAGAEIIVHGHATNGVANAMAQGKVYVAGNVGARAMTMTKHNPSFDPPELWVLGSAGDYFAEFMAGGIVVVCGYKAQDQANILGYRPAVGMVGGKILFRGPCKGFSQADARLAPLNDKDWEWLFKNLRIFLEKIGQPDILDSLSDQQEWHLLVARSPFERAAKPRLSMSAFNRDVWEKELGAGGLIGDLTDLNRDSIPVITTGKLRRFTPIWENRKYLPFCEAGCPTGIPVHECWRLIREGRLDKAINLALTYTPFPASVCGYLCPNLCMQNCIRQTAKMVPLDMKHLGRAGLDSELPALPHLTGRRIAVIGGGPAGISVAWQLRQQGHEAAIFEAEEKIGGKVTLTVPGTRIPEEVIDVELERVRKALPHIKLQQRLTGKDLNQLKVGYDFIVIAVGAQKPLILPVPGRERMISALDFLRQSKQDMARAGKRVVVIGAGNVGCDVATEAHRLGAEEITLVDIQEPASFGEERMAAEAAGAKFRWPVFIRAVTGEGVALETGEVIPADTVIVSIGDRPDLDLLPETVATEQGFIKVNDIYQTTDPQIFAIGDAVKLGLLTDAIGAGRKAATAINNILAGKQPEGNRQKTINCSRIRLEYFDPRLVHFDDVQKSAVECASCGVCRDCEICIAICPERAICKQEEGNEDFKLVVDSDRCIGCGFCAQSCPCGIWSIVEAER